MFAGILGAIIRVWDGSGKWRSILHPNVLMALTILVTAYMSLPLLWGLFVAVLAYVSYLLGPSRFIKELTGEGWESWWMTLRYSAVFIVASGLAAACPEVSFAYGGLLSILVATLGGLSYPFASRYLPDYLHPTRWAEGMSGFGMVAGVALL